MANNVVRGQTVETKIGPLTVADTSRVGSWLLVRLVDADGDKYLARVRPGKSITRGTGVSIA